MTNGELQAELQKRAPLMKWRVDEDSWLGPRVTAQIIVGKNWAEHPEVLTCSTLLGSEWQAVIPDNTAVDLLLNEMTRKLAMELLGQGPPK